MHLRQCTVLTCTQQSLQENPGTVCIGLFSTFSFAITSAVHVTRAQNFQNRQLMSTRWLIKGNSIGLLAREFWETLRRLNRRQLSVVIGNGECITFMPTMWRKKMSIQTHKFYTTDRDGLRRLQAAYVHVCQWIFLWLSFKLLIIISTLIMISNANLISGERADTVLAIYTTHIHAGMHAPNQQILCRMLLLWSWIQRLSSTGQLVYATNTGALKKNRNAAHILTA